MQETASHERFVTWKADGMALGIYMRKDSRQLRVCWQAAEVNQNWHAGRVPCNSPLSGFTGQRSCENRA